MTALRILRAACEALLWACAVVGVLSALLWVGGRAGWSQTFIVASGSMSPHIRTGDLLVDRPVPVSSLHVGEVVTLRNPSDGDSVTHRVIRLAAPEKDDTTGRPVAAISGIDPSLPSQRTVTLKGDANHLQDPYAYQVAGTVWTPWIRLPGVGTWIAHVMRPQVMLPGLIALVALLALSMTAMPRTPIPSRRAAHRAA